MLLKSREPHHNLSACKTSAKTQDRISSSICSCPEPKAPPSSNLGPEEQKSDSSSHSPSRLLLLRQSCQKQSEPTTFGNVVQSIIKTGVTPNSSDSVNIWWHFICYKQGMNLNWDLKNDEGWVIHTDFSLIKLDLTYSQFAACYIWTVY